MRHLSHLLFAAFLLAACSGLKPGFSGSATGPRNDCSPESVAKECQSETLQAWMATRDTDVVDARAFDARIARSKIPVQSDIVKTAVRNEKGRLVVLEIWKGSFMGLPPEQLTRPGSALGVVVEEAAGFAAARSEPMHLIVSVPARDKARLTQWLNTGLRRGGNKVEVRWLTLKQGDLPFLRIEPLNPKEYSFGRP